MRFKKTWYSSSNDLTAIPDKLPADFEKVGATATLYWTYLEKLVAARSTIVHKTEL